MLIGQNVKNYLINSQFDFWQRRTSGTLGAGSSAWGYFADRGYVATAGGGGTTSAMTVSRVAYPGSDNSQAYIWRVANASLGASLGAASYHVAYSQKVEDVRTFAGKTVTFSIWATTTVPNKVLAVNIEQQFGVGGSSTTFQAASITLTGGATLTRYDVSINLPSISGKIIGSGNDHAVGVYVYSQIGSSAAAVVGLDAFGLQGIGNIDIYRVMLNEGPPADFETAGGGDLGVELLMCQRFFQKTFPLSVTPQNGPATSTLGALAVSFSATSNILAQWQLKTTMRAAPVVTLYNPSSNGATGQWRNGSDTASSSNASVSSGNENIVNIGNSDVFLPAHTWYIHATADAEL